MSRTNSSLCRHRSHKFHAMITCLIFIASIMCPITYALNHPNAYVKMDVGSGISQHRNNNFHHQGETDIIQYQYSHHHHDILHSIRGGANDDDDNDRPVTIFSLVGNTIIGSILAFKRSILAGVDALQEESMSPIGRIFHMMTSMVKAAWDKDYEIKGGTSSSSPSSKSSSKNLASYFCNAYGVSLDESDDEEDEDEDGDNESIKIIGGSLSNALQKARSKARLLVVFVPGDKPKKQSKYDKVAIQSLMSSKVHSIAERNARKKEEGHGSFLFWGATYNSNEATLALKRLKAKSKSSSNTNTNNPTIMVVYPSPSVDSSGSRIKIIPRVLAQHHCNPPPSGDVMSSWLNALRKRHVKQYTSMQLELKERALFEERREGYQSSMKDDQKREREEQRKEEEREREEQARKEKEEMLKQRRKALLENLPDEPGRGADGYIVTIALRFSDGKRGQRRFDGETASLEDVFNWVDAMFEMERERVVLATMNGQKTFMYDDGDYKKEMTLKDVGLGKMAALRVTEQEDEKQEVGSDNDDGSDEDGEYEEDED